MGIHPREPKCTTFCARHFYERLQTACTKAIAAELVNVSMLWDLNVLKEEELLCLLGSLFGVLEVKGGLDRTGKKNR